MSLFFKFPLLAVGALLLTACTGEVTDPDDIPDETTTGRLNVFLESMPDTQGLPLTVESVWLRFEDVLVRSEDEGWISIGDDRRDIDLMSLRGGNPIQLGSEDIFEGPYDAVRMLIADSWIIVDGEQYELAISRFLELPGDGTDFSADFFVDDGVTTSIGMKWDLDTQLTGADADWTLGTVAEITVSLD